MNRKTNAIIKLLIVVALCNISNAALAANGTWTNTISGGLWSSPENWQAGVVAEGNGSSADFSTLNILSNNTVHLDAPHTISSVTFGDTDITSAASWVMDNNGFTTNTLTLSGSSPSITVDALGEGATATISAGLAGTSGLIKDGAGTLVLSASNTYSGVTSIEGGILNAALTESLTGAVSLSNEAELSFSQEGTALNLAGHPANSSGLYGGNAYRAFDGNPGTGWWSGNYSVPAWIYVDMLASHTLGRVDIAWERANGRDYTIRIATQEQFDANDDPSTWPIAATVGNNQLYSQDASVWSVKYLDNPTKGRYLAIHCTGSNWEPNQINLMINIWEIRAYEVTDYALSSLNGENDTTVDLGGNRLTLTGNDSQLFRGTIKNGSLTKSGTGTLTLSNANYYGETAIDAGTICLNGYDSYQDVAAYYQFNDSGNLGADSSGNGNNLVTASGSPAYSSDGKYGGALYLDGASTLNVGGSFPVGVPTGSSPFTVSAWIKPTTQCAVQRGGWVGWGNTEVNEANNFRLLDENANAVWIYWWGNDLGGWLPYGKRFDDGVYHSVVVTWDGTTEIIYLDGIEVNRRNPTPPNIGAAQLYSR